MSENVASSAADGRPPQTWIGLASLTKMAFAGEDLGPLWNSLLEEVARNPSSTAAVMDMAIVAQLLGDQKSGLALQSGALNIDRLYRSRCGADKPRLRVLAFAAPTDIGGNTPIEFLLEGGDIELYTLYVVPGAPLPTPLPEHDIAIVVAPASESTLGSLSAIGALAKNWPRSVLNSPARIAELDRDRLHLNLRSIARLEIPETIRVSRTNIEAMGNEAISLSEILEGGKFPLIVRPVDSHAGRGLSKLESNLDIPEYLASRPEDEFFLSAYVDYSSADGLFRKYRIVFVDGRPYACHMAISDQWKIWYLNADMAQSAEKRAEEENFMATFDEQFVGRHRKAFDEMTQKVGLEYFAIDCAETASGNLLLFEADNAMIVHNMDPADVFPYKPPQMRKIFEAFASMLYKYAASSLVRAA
jgi:glutathione synthase/RimK-type ligase-like ATP-grasp enzyme